MRRLAFGQVPILELEGQRYAQSGAILRWAGRQAKLYPDDGKLQLRCDAVEEALNDIKKLLPPLWYKSMAGRDPVSKGALVPIPEDLLEEVKQKLNEVALPIRLGQLEEVLKQSGGPLFPW